MIRLQNVLGRELAKEMDIDPAITISLVMASLNEEATIESCIKKAYSVFESMGVAGEVIVADSSSDATPRIARSLGARVVIPSMLGYGNAYIEGFAHARGRFIVMADADGTYEIEEIPLLIEPLLEGRFDLVTGTRLCGRIEPGAMPWHHRYIGNPVLTKLLNYLFKTGITDSHCGMRAITRDALERLNLSTGGMEFASEMMIEATRKGLRITEVPITYHKRKAPSKLHSLRDGWRHLRFMLLYRPLPFLALPGLLIMLLGLALSLAILLGGDVERSNLHSFIFSTFILIIGLQMVATGLYLKAYSQLFGFSETRGVIDLILCYHSLERELIIGSALLASSLFLGGRIIFRWVSVGFGSLQEVVSAVIAMTLGLMGIQIIFAAITLSVFLLDTKMVNIKR